MFRILLVDDDEDMREITKRWLSKSYKVSQAASGEEAVHFLKQNGADLVLLDYRMPGINGAETLAAIRQDISLKDIPVYFLTGEEDSANMDEAVLLGAQGYLKKSGGKRSLMETVSAVFSENR